MTHEELKREIRTLRAEMREMKALLATLVVQQSPLMNMHDAAKRLNCSYRQMQRLVADGEINCVLVGKRKMFTEQSLHSYLQGH